MLVAWSNTELVELINCRIIPTTDEVVQLPFKRSIAPFKAKPMEPLELNLESIPPPVQQSLGPVDQPVVVPGTRTPGVQNNIDDLWTWSINGAKIAGSFALITGSIAVIQALLRYWRDSVLTWWARAKRRWNNVESSDEEETSDMDYDASDDESQDD